VHDDALAFAVEAALAIGALITANKAIAAVIAAVIDASTPAPTLPAMNADPRFLPNFMVAP
jgi:hypothetical protein